CVDVSGRCRARNIGAGEHSRLLEFKTEKKKAEFLPPAKTPPAFLLEIPPAISPNAPGRGWYSSSRDPESCGGAVARPAALVAYRNSESAICGDWLAIESA